MAILRMVVVLALSAVFILDATSAQKIKSCGRDFTRRVMEVCATEVKRTEDFMVKRATELWNDLMESSPGLNKREEMGTAVYCCTYGCTDQEITLVC